ncbi:hypothetical protein TSOC_011579, partial [Tetrabaena socialis]
AEASVLKVMLSQALGGPSQWLKGGAVLLDLNSSRAQVRVRGSLVAAMRRRAANDFYDTIGSCRVFQVERPAGSPW